MKIKVCILLTACVNPGGMSHTVLQDPVIRANQYKKALDFYIKETSVPIVFCENTMYDISYEYKDQIDSGRLEYFTFDGNNYDKSKGKGYGEALIMKYAIDNSVIIKNSRYVIKITGRIVITDIRRFLHSSLYFFDNLFRSNVNDKFIVTYVFIARPKLIRTFISKYIELIKEVPPSKESIEYQWYKALTMDSELSKTIFIPFISIPNVIGFSGTTGEPYSMKDRLTANLAYAYRFEIARNHKLLAFFYLGAYYVIYFFKRISASFLKEKE